MRYIDAFLPVFSLVAHAEHAGAGDSDSANFRADLEQLLSAARAGRTASGALAFDNAWFALCSWLDARLAGGPCGGGGPHPFLDRYFPDRGGEDFLARLAWLLEAQAERPEAARAAVIDLFGYCLDFGLTEGRDREMRTRAEELRHRCRELGGESAGARKGGGLLCREAGKAGRGGGSRGKRRGMWAHWLVPVGVSLGLFLLYHALLAEMFANL